MGPFMILFLTLLNLNLIRGEETTDLAVESTNERTYKVYPDVQDSEEGDHHYPPYRSSSYDKQGVGTWKTGHGGSGPWYLQNNNQQSQSTSGQEQSSQSADANAETSTRQEYGIAPQALYLQHSQDENESESSLTEGSRQEFPGHKTSGFSSHVEHFTEKENELLSSDKASLQDIKRTVPKSSVYFKIYHNGKNGNDQKLGFESDVLHDTPVKHYHHYHRHYEQSHDDENAGYGDHTYDQSQQHYGSSSSYGQLREQDKVSPHPQPLLYIKYPSHSSSGFSQNSAKAGAAFDNKQTDQKYYKYQHQEQAGADSQVAKSQQSYNVAPASNSNLKYGGSTYQNYHQSGLSAHSEQTSPSQYSQVGSQQQKHSGQQSSAYGSNGDSAAVSHQVKVLGHSNANGQALGHTKVQNYVKHSSPAENKVQDYQTHGNYRNGKSKSLYDYKQHSYRVKSPENPPPVYEHHQEEKSHHQHQQNQPEQKSQYKYPQEHQQRQYQQEDDQHNYRHHYQHQHEHQHSQHQQQNNQNQYQYHNQQHQNSNQEQQNNYQQYHYQQQKQNNNQQQYHNQQEKHNNDHQYNYHQQEKQNHHHQQYLYHHHNQEQQQNNNNHRYHHQPQEHQQQENYNYHHYQNDHYQKNEQQQQQQQQQPQQQQQNYNHQYHQSQQEQSQNTYNQHHYQQNEKEQHQSYQEHHHDSYYPPKKEIHPHKQVLLHKEVSQSKGNSFDKGVSSTYSSGALASTFVPTKQNDIVPHRYGKNLGKLEDSWNSYSHHTHVKLASNSNSLGKSPLLTQPADTFHYTVNPFIDIGEHGETTHSGSFDHQKALEGSTSFDINHAIGTGKEEFDTTSFISPTTEIHTLGNVGDHFTGHFNKHPFLYSYPTLQVSSTPSVSFSKGSFLGESLASTSEHIHPTVSTTVTKLGGKYFDPQTFSVLSSDYFKQGPTLTETTLSHPLVKLHFPNDQEIFQNLKGDVSGNTLTSFYKGKHTLKPHKGSGWEKFVHHDSQWQSSKKKPQVLLPSRPNQKHLPELNSDWNVHKIKIRTGKANKIIIKPEVLPYVQELGKKTYPVTIRKTHNRTNREAKAIPVVDQSFDRGSERHFQLDGSNSVNEYDPRNGFSVTASYKIDRSFNKALNK